MYRAILRSTDLIAAVLGAVIGAVIIVFSYVWRIQQHDIGLALLLACVLYILLRKKLSATANKQLSLQHNRKILLLTNIIFLLAFTASILLLKFNLYYRPPVYFVLVSIAAASIAFEIFYTSKESRSIPLIILKIIALSLSVRVGLFYEFPTMMGADSWWHLWVGSTIADTGHISSAVIETGRETAKWQNFPLLHILIATTKLVTNVSSKDALFISIGLASVFSTTFIYLIGKNVGGIRLGLMAMLILNVSDMLIVRGVTNITTGSLVLCYFMFLLFLIFRQRSSTMATYSLMVLLIPAIVLTHQLTVFASLILVIGLLIGKVLYNSYYIKDPELASSLRTTRVVHLDFNFVVFFAVGMLAYWMYHPLPQPLGVSFWDIAVSRIAPVFQREVFNPIAGAYVTSLSSYSAWTNFIYHIGYIILLCFTTTGFLLWLSLNKTDRARFTLIIGVLLLSILIYLSPLTALRYAFIPHRFLPFVYIIFSLLAVQAILSLTGIFRQIWYKSLLTSAAMLILSFFMLTTPFICPDTPYSKNRAARTGFRSSEVQAANTMARVYNGKLILEGKYSNVFYYMLPTHDLELGGLKPKVGSDFRGVVMLGRDLLVRGSAGGTFGKRVPTVFGQDYFDMVDQIPGSCLIYNNHEVIAYIIR